MREPFVGLGKVVVANPDLDAGLDRSRCPLHGAAGGRKIGNLTCVLSFERTELEVGSYPLARGRRES